MRITAVAARLHQQQVEGASLGRSKIESDNASVGSFSSAGRILAKARSS
jgi:hypothetical protein